MAIAVSPARDFARALAAAVCVSVSARRSDTSRAAFKYRYSVVTPPQLPRGPLKPYGMLFAAGGAAGGIALALFLSAAMDILSGRIIERWQVEQQLGLTVYRDMRM